PIDGDSFRLYVEKILLPTLRPGDVVVMDNVGSHRGKVVRQLIRSTGAKLFFLPKYSPDLNPIEQVFAKLNTSYEKLRPARLKRFASPSVKLFISSHPNSAHATWQTQDMDEPKFITLYPPFRRRNSSRDAFVFFRSRTLNQ